MSTPSPPQGRLLSLDVLRGLTIILMIVVNTASGYGYSDGVATYSFFLHADWAGVRPADIVFPFFMVMVGVSIPFALGRLKDGDGLTWATTGRLAKRGAMLFAIGLALNIWFFFLYDKETLRILGVLQRIGIGFFAASILYLLLSWRGLLALVLVILVGYWPLAYLPIPDGTPVNLLQPGADFISYVDRVILGAHAYKTGPLGFDPEGLLDTLPPIAQTVMGILMGLWIRSARETGAMLKGLVVAGIAMTVAGYLWGLSFPLIKAIWSSSFTLLTTGLAALTLAALYSWLDVKGGRGPWVQPCQSFGLNSITAYVLHTAVTVGLNGIGITALGYGWATGFVSLEAASLVPILMVLVVTWIPIHWMQGRGIIMKV